MALPRRSPRGDGAGELIWRAPGLQSADLRLRMDDGAGAPATLWTPIIRPQAYVIGLHSFGDYRRSFEALGPYLALRGIACLAFDQRGFGETRPFGRFAAPARYMEDAACAARWVRRRFAGPIFVVGESMGGAVAILLAAHKPHLVAGLALANPAVRRNQPYRGQIDLALGAAALLQLAYCDTRDCPTISDAARARLARDPRVVRRVRASALAGAGRLTNLATSAACAVKAPAFILHGERDWLIHRRCIDALSEDLGPKAQLKRYPDAPHLLLQAPDRFEAFEDIAAWIERQAKARVARGQEQNLPKLHCNEGYNWEVSA